MKREVECARRFKKKVIPVWIEDCPVPTTFEGRDVIDFRPRKRKHSGEVWRELFVEPLIRNLVSFRFWLAIATVAALVSVPIAFWKFYVANQLQEQIKEKKLQVIRLANEKSDLSRGNEQAKEELEKKRAEVTKSNTAATVTKQQVEQSQKDLASVRSQLTDTEGKLKVTSEELSNIQSRLICVMDSVTRREMMGRICGELSSLPNLTDQEPISVGRASSEFRKQITDSATALTAQMKSINERHPALIIVHLHALRPEKQKSSEANPDPNADFEASELLAALTHLRGTDKFPAPDILVYSRSTLTTKSIVGLAGDSVKEEIASMESRIHSIEAPMAASTSDTTALGRKVEKILEERAKRLGRSPSTAP